MSRNTLLSCVCLAACAAVVDGQSGPPSGLRADARAGTVPPAWAYTINSPVAPGAAPPAEDTAPKQVPNSAVRLTRAQLGDLFNPPDWHPDNHATAPEVVAHGRKPDVRACGYCHPAACATAPI